MTNKLEEVFKELQESHVLVDREEYEKLVEKAEELDVEEVKLEVGGYYSKASTVYEINKLGGKSSLISAYTEPSYFASNVNVSISDGFVKSLRKATDEEIKLFKRAEMYHKHGRKLDELKVGDFLKMGKEIYQIKNGTTSFIQSIFDGRHELYLTIEEAQEAHKKIVGE